MKKLEAEQKLEVLVGAEINQSEVQNAIDYAYDSDGLFDFIDGVDEQEFFLDDFSDVDIYNTKVVVYSVDDDERDMTAFMVMEGESVLAIGYTGD